MATRVPALIQLSDPRVAAQLVIHVCMEHLSKLNQSINQSINQPRSSNLHLLGRKKKSDKLMYSVVSTIQSVELLKALYTGRPIRSETN